MNIITGNLLDIPGPAILAHQVNCQRVAGAGLALQIRRKWPGWYQDYLTTYPKLGTVSLYPIGYRWIANLYAQRQPETGRRATDYNALTTCLIELCDRSFRLSLPVYVPQGMSCGLAGGTWSVVFGLLEQYCPQATIVRLEKP